MSLATFWYPFLNKLNRLVSRLMYSVKPFTPCPLPPNGSVLLVSDHSTLGDPLVLLATAGRPLHFLIAREIYKRQGLKWVFQAFQTIPVSRGEKDVSALRSMLKVLEQGKVVALFPEGGIENFRDESGYLGVAYLAIKTGAPVVPVSILWGGHRPTSILGTLFVPGKVTVRYGEPLYFQFRSNFKRQELEDITKQVMDSIKSLRGEKVL